MAMLLALTLTVTMLACDDPDAELDAQASAEQDTAGSLNEKAPGKPNKNNGNNGNHNGNASVETDSSMIDNKFEELANAALSDADELTITSFIGITMTSPSMPVPMTNDTQMIQAIKGGNVYVYMDAVTSTMGTVASQMTVETSQIGTDFYVLADTYDLQNGNASAKYHITATEQDIDEANKALGTAEIPELTNSVKDFFVVSVKTRNDGSTVYTCKGMKDAAAEKYESLCEALAKQYDARFDLDEEGLSFTVVVKDGKFVSSEVKMSLELTMSGATIDCAYVISNTYEYTAEEITAPEKTAEYQTMSWDKYISMIS